MSLKFRERLRALEKTQLEISEEEWNKVWENIGDFCMASDLAIKARYGENANEEAEVTKMSDDEFLGFARAIVQNVLRKLGYRKKKRAVDDLVQEELERTFDTQGREMLQEAQGREQAVYAL